MRLRGNIPSTPIETLPNILLNIPKKETDSTKTNTKNRSEKYFTNIASCKFYLSSGTNLDVPCTQLDLIGSGPKAAYRIRVDLLLCSPPRESCRCGLYGVIFYAGFPEL